MARPLGLRWFLKVKTHKLLTTRRQRTIFGGCQDGINFWGNLFANTEITSLTAWRDVLLSGSAVASFLDWWRRFEAINFGCNFVVKICHCLKWWIVSKPTKSRQIVIFKSFWGRGIIVIDLMSLLTLRIPKDCKILQRTFMSKLPSKKDTLMHLQK